MSFSVKIEPTEDDKSDTEAEPELVIDDDDREEEMDGRRDVKGDPVKDSLAMISPPATVSDLYSAIASAPRRCETCDIKFTYLKSYLAHKEFYCKERNNNGTPSGGVGAAAANSKSNAGSDGMKSPSNGIQSTVTNSRASAEVQ